MFIVSESARESEAFDHLVFREVRELRTGEEVMMQDLFFPLLCVTRASCTERDAGNEEVSRVSNHSARSPLESGHQECEDTLTNATLPSMTVCSLCVLLKKLKDDMQVRIKTGMLRMMNHRK